MEEEIIIRIQDAGIDFKGYSLNNVNLEIPKGYITGVIGPNGAGKSTLLKMIMGLYPKMRGSISVGGYDCLKQRENVLDITGFVSEEREFFMEYSAMENENMYRPFYPKWNEKKYQEYLRMMDIPANTKLCNLSKGNYIKYQFAFALAAESRILILDEPTAGLDPVFRADFLKLLQKLIAQEEMTVLISTNIKEDLDRIADYIIGFEQGSCYIKEAGYED